VKSLDKTTLNTYKHVLFMQYFAFNKEN